MEGGRVGTLEVFLSEDIPNPLGHFPLSPAPGDPILQGSETGRSAEVPSNPDYPANL